MIRPQTAKHSMAALQKLRLPLESTAIAKHALRVIFKLLKTKATHYYFGLHALYRLVQPKIRYLNNKSYLLSAKRYVKTSIIRKLRSLSGNLMNVKSLPNLKHS